MKRPLQRDPSRRGSNPRIAKFQLSRGADVPAKPVELKAEKKASVLASASPKPSKITAPAPNPIPPYIMDEPASFSPLQWRFIEQYVIDWNGTKAAIRAGYSKNGAAQQASELLRMGKVAAEIRKRRAEMANRYGITADKVMRELALCAFASAKDFIGPGNSFIPISDMTDEEAAAIAEVTIEEFTDGRSDKRHVRRTKYKMVPKRDALELLGKNLGLFAEKVDHTHLHQHTILGRIMDEIDERRRDRLKTIEHEPSDRSE